MVLQVQRTLKAAAPFVDALRERGVRVVTIPIGSGRADQLAALKSEFRCGATCTCSCSAENRVQGRNVTLPLTKNIIFKLKGDMTILRVIFMHLVRYYLIIYRLPLPPAISYTA